MATFDDLVSDMDGAMVIVTTEHGGERAGCLVGFHGQCSIHPPMYAVWLSNLNRTSEVASAATHLAVHVLSRRDHPIAELFGGETGDEVDKFAECTWTAGPGGVPLLDDCPNRFVVERVTLLDAGGDHRCVVGRPVDAQRVAAVEPLRLAGVLDIDAGHPPDEQLDPPSSRAD